MLRGYYGTYSVSKSNHNKINSGLGDVPLCNFIMAYKSVVRILVELKTNRPRARNIEI